MAAPVVADLDAGPASDAARAPPSPPADARGIVDAGVEASAPLDAVIDVSFVSLSVSHASLQIDAKGRGVFQAARGPIGLELGGDDGTVVEGALPEASVRRVVELARHARLCATKLPPDEPMVWIDVRVHLDDLDCRVRMSPTEWHRRQPAVLRAIHGLEHEVCSGSCPRSPRFD